MGLLAAGAVIVIVPLCTPVGSEYGKSIRRRVVGVKPVVGSSIIQTGSETSAVKFTLAPFVVTARGIESSGYGGRNVKLTTAGLTESTGFEAVDVAISSVPVAALPATAGAPAATRLVLTVSW